MSGGKVIVSHLNSRRLSILLSLAIAAVLVAGYAGTGTTPGEDPESPGSDTVRVDVAYGFEVKDEEKLVGFAENVFTGRVIERVGSEEMSVPSDSGIPQTQFTVRPLENIKGELTGPVTVNQQGGSMKQNGEKKKVLIEGDPLLEPGEEYLFVTRYEESKNWHTIAAQPFGDVKIKDKDQRKKLKEKFKQARKEQKDPAKEFSKR